ncbi:TSC22 domain family protein 2-like isoform X2 [Myxocyprinus asiaticus]|uniref:TSC22 domain family protein 2-like isoform X2 n=1 Tax=Myxocyprinus asiaticus TaxID=70543 RepID=UPI0022238A2E|nr:TSC22 domain family protein 2-like isoform X2 [Myxocyprinus asiaticus]
MSKMSKKKSCFQITSVTQAQVGASSITDDTESLDDPDESRTEDMSSSEIYDMSKFGDFEQGACNVSLSDEPLNNDLETSGASLSMTIPGSCNTGGLHTNPNVRGVIGAASQMTTASVPSQPSSSVAGGVASNAPSSLSQTSTSFCTSATVSSCSSRFRVIKLDHSTGEPFKRGRWTCTEFYERDTDVSSSGRTVDNVKQAGILDHNVDRDGLAVPVAAEPHTDSGYMSVPSNPPVELQQQSFGISQQGLGNIFPAGTGDAHIQHVKSPSMPSTTQPQAFHPGKLAQNPGHILPAGIPSNPSDYRSQHQPPLQTPISSAQTLTVTSIPLGVPLNRGSSPVMTPAAGSTHVLGLVPPQAADTIGHGRGPLPISHTEHIQGLIQQSGIGAALGTATAVVSQAPVPLIQPAVTTSVTPHALVPGVQNVPVMSSASNTPQSMPNQTPVPVVQPQQDQPQGVHSGSTVGLSMQTSPSNFSQLPISTTQADENRRNSDALPQSFVIIGKDATKALNPECLKLPTPAVNSLFGITIPIDGDDDGASGASVVAIDNKIEQAMDLVKSHLMYAVREEVEVLKEQIKELYERNSLLERENAVLKSLANTEQLNQLTNPESTSPQQTGVNAILQEGSKLVTLPPHPNVSTA